MKERLPNRYVGIGGAAVGAAVIYLLEHLEIIDGALCRAVL